MKEGDDLLLAGLDRLTLGKSLLVFGHPVFAEELELGHD